MPGRAEVVVRVDPVSSLAVVVVSGTAHAALVGELTAVLRRAAEVVGPHVRVDLTRCDVVAPAVLDLLHAERSRLRARGGSLSYDRVALDGALADASLLDGASLDGAGLAGAPARIPSATSRRLVASVRRRTDAVDVGPERDEAGEELRALLAPTATVEVGEPGRQG